MNQPQDDVSHALGLRVRGVGQHHQTALADAALGPLRHRHLQRIADCRLSRASTAQRVDHLPAVTEQRDVSEYLHPVLGTDPHKEFAVAPKVAGAERGAPVEVADVAEHLAPLAGQQIDDVNPLRRSLQQGHLWTEEVDVGIGGDPAALAPGRHALQLERELVRLRRDLDGGADRDDLIAAADLDSDTAGGEIDNALAGDVTVLIAAIDELGVVILEPVRIHFAMVTARRQVLAGLAVQVESGSYRLASALVDHPQPYRSVRRGNRIDPKR